MIRLSAIWLLCAGLVLTRFIGLHLHACVEPGMAHHHETSEVAGVGSPFESGHANDHAESHAIQPWLPSSGTRFGRSSDDLDEIVAGAPGAATSIAIRPLVVLPRRALAHAPVSRLPHLLPPSRGPPIDFLA